MNTNLQSAGDRDREFVFTAKDFERVRQLIYDHAGISLNPSKQDMVYSRLARRLRATGINNFRDYLALLESNDEVEWQAFVNSLTTNLTSFFREPHHFPLLAEHVLKQKGRHPVSLWCSAASTGEEPYSMAMTMVDAFGSFTPPVTIVATDLDTNVLAKAEAGVYPLERIEKLARERYACFELFGRDAQTYGMLTGYHRAESCEEAVVRQLVELRRSAAEYMTDGLLAEDDYFYAEMNARI